MMLLLDNSQVERTINALALAASDYEARADEAQKLADAGHSDGLVYDYGPVARLFRESAERYRALGREIERQREAARDDGGD